MITVAVSSNSRLKWISILFLFCAIPCFSNAYKKTKTEYEKYDKEPAAHKNKLFGLYTDELIQQRKFKEARQALLQGFSRKDLPKDVIEWRLLKIAVLEGRIQEFRRRLTRIKNKVIGKNPALMSEIYGALKKKEQLHLVHYMSQAGFFTQKPASSCPYFELDKRKSRGQFLYQLVREHNLKEKNDIFYELYVSLPEVVEISLLKKLDGFDDFLNQRKTADFVARMEMLLVFGKNTEARTTFEDASTRLKTLPQEERCELLYTDVKVDRKLKKYKTARERFSSLEKDCPEHVRKKARFLNLMLASMMGDENSARDFENFVVDYPDDSFADDVLLFLANLYLDRGNIEQAQAVLKRIIDEYPKGDMLPRALFLYGFNAAKMGNTDTAIESFRTLSKVSPKDSIDFASAQYWTGRLLLFADVTSLTNLKKDNVAQAKKELSELFNLQVPNFYSWLALSLLETSGQEFSRATLHKKKSASTYRVKAVEADINFIKDLVMTGFRQEALMLLDDVDVDKNAIDRAVLMAQLYDTLNRPEAGHQQLVRCSPSLANILSEKIPETLQRISYPRPYRIHIHDAISKVDVPTALIYAVMRQESGFLTSSCSWAGAKGLMQLIYPSAVSQARVLGIRTLREDELYNPKLNILIGASLLQKYWQQFGNVVVGLSAYNAGPKMAATWMKKNDDAPLDTFVENISFKETRSYVKTVLGNAFAYIVNDHDNLLRLELGMKKSIKSP